MFVTITPFIAEGVASDWHKASRCLNRTLSSILANPQKQLRAIVVCQDQPKLSVHDNRYIYLKSNRPKPNKSDIHAKRLDKAWKIIDAFDFARSLSPEYVMILDADDLVSNQLLSYVYNKPKYDAFCLKWGFEWKEGSIYLTKRPFFNQYCGSSFIWRFNEGLFPAWLGKSSTKMVADQSHSQVEEAMENEGFLVDKVIDPKVIYVTGHSNNLGYKRRIKREIKDFILSPWRNMIISEQIKNEYSIDK